MIQVICGLFKYIKALYLQLTKVYYEIHNKH